MGPEKIHFFRKIDTPDFFHWPFFVAEGHKALLNGHFDPEEYLKHKCLTNNPLIFLMNNLSFFVNFV